MNGVRKSASLTGRAAGQALELLEKFVVPFQAWKQDAIDAWGAAWASGFAQPRTKG